MAKKFPSQKTLTKSKNQLELPKELKETLEPEQLEILEDLPADKQAKLIAIFSSKTSSFQGPIPPPDILKGYEDTIVGGADRILRMAELQLEHRTTLESKVIEKQQKQSGRGQIMGFILASLCLASSTFLGYTGHDWLAGTIATTTILGLTATFVLGKIRQDKDLNNKR